METTKDIVNEIRTFAKHSSWVSPGTLREFADRIEAAWRQDMMAFGRWLKERHNLNVLDEEMERYVERELEREYGDY